DHLLFSSPDAPTTTTYTLSLHDALPIYFDGVAAGLHAVADGRVQCQAVAHLPDRSGQRGVPRVVPELVLRVDLADRPDGPVVRRSEEHTSELQSRGHLVCRLLLEKKNRL